MVRYKLVKVNPEELTKSWPLMKFSIVQSFPPATDVSEEALSNMFQAAQAGRLDLWFIYDTEPEPMELALVLTTTLNHDTISGTNSMFIYTITALKNLPIRAHAQGLLQLREVARNAGCSFITARVSDERWIKTISRLGFKTDVRMIEMEV